jgi:hypothetical protein
VIVAASLKRRDVGRHRAGCGRARSVIAAASLKRGKTRSDWIVKPGFCGFPAAASLKPVRHVMIDERHFGVSAAFDRSYAKAGPCPQHDRCGFIEEFRSRSS